MPRALWARLREGQIVNRVGKSCCEAWCVQDRRYACQRAFDVFRAFCLEPCGILSAKLCRWKGIGWGTEPCRTMHLNYNPACGYNYLDAVSPL